MHVLYWLNVGLKDTTEELVQKKEKSKRKKDGELSVFEREREKKREKAKLQKKDKKNKEKQLDIQSKVFTVNSCLSHRAFLVCNEMVMFMIVAFV